MPSLKFFLDMDLHFQPMPFSFSLKNFFLARWDCRQQIPSIFCFLRSSFSLHPQRIKDNVTGYRILAWVCFFFFFSTPWIFHSTLFLLAWFLRRGQMSSFLLHGRSSLAAFWLVSLSLAFCKFGNDTLRYSFPAILWASWSCGLGSDVHFGKAVSRKGSKYFFWFRLPGVYDLTPCSWRLRYFVISSLIHSHLNSAFILI